MGGLLFLVFALPFAVLAIDTQLPGFLCDLEDALRGRRGEEEDMQDLLGREGE